MAEGGFSNRTDLMDTSRSPGQAPASQQGQAQARQHQAAAMPASAPMQRPPVLGPTRRPNEPVQAGLPIGPGPASHSLPGRRDQAMGKLQALVAESRDPQLAVLVGRMAASARGGEVPVNRGRRGGVAGRSGAGPTQPGGQSPHGLEVPPGPPTLRDVGRGRDVEVV